MKQCISYFTVIICCVALTKQKQQLIKSQFYCKTFYQGKYKGCTSQNLAHPCRRNLISGFWRRNKANRRICTALLMGYQFIAGYLPAFRQLVTQQFAGSNLFTWETRASSNSRSQSPTHLPMSCNVFHCGFIG